MPRNNETQLAGPNMYLDAVRDPGLALREHFKNDPIGLAERLGLKVPRKPLLVMRELGLYSEEEHGPIEPGLAELISDVCKLEIFSAAVVGPRGGGKSQGVSFIEFFCVFVLLFDALNLGGSELQADQVYQYLTAYIESDEYWKRMVVGDPMASRTNTIDNAWIRVLTASQRSVRSPHAGGRKPGGRMAGGILVIDEEAEASADIVGAALPTINTARPSVNIRSSTFHNATGSFADLIDSHEEMGYKLYRWNVFDVSERCTDDCETCEPCFAKDHYEDVLNPDTGLTENRLIHKAYCGGVAHYSEGWVPIDETRKLWRRMKRNHSQFEVEQMGSRPSSGGAVIKDSMKFSETITRETGEALYQERCPITICVDWGSSNAGVTVWQEHRSDRHALLHADLLIENSETQIFGVILGYAAKYRDTLSEIAGDIGGGGSYFNPKLRDEYRMPMRDVNFGEEKETAVAAWNIYNEAGKLIIPAEHEDFIRQIRNWRRVNGRIQKGNDHLCDASICYFAKFVDRLGIKRVPVPPKTFNSGSSQTGQTGGRAHAPVRRPVGIRVIGGRR